MWQYNDTCLGDKPLVPGKPASKPAVPGKPAPKPKPKHSTASSVSGLSDSSIPAAAGTAEWGAPGAMQHSNDDYANLPLAGAQVGPGQGAYPADEVSVARPHNVYYIVGLQRKRWYFNL